MMSKQTIINLLHSTLGLLCIRESALASPSIKYDYEFRPMYLKLHISVGAF